GFRGLTFHQRQFLTAYTQIGTIEGAARRCGQCRRNHYRWLHEDVLYADAFREAEEISVEELETVCQEMARSREQVPLLFLLKAKRPHIYRDNFDWNKLRGKFVLLDDLERAANLLDRDELPASLQPYAKRLQDLKRLHLDSQKQASNGNGNGSHPQPNLPSPPKQEEP